MSTLAEKIEAEAQAAEAEFPDDPDDLDNPPEPTEPEPDPEPEPPAEPMSEKEWEALAKKMDAESVRHEKRVRELFAGGAADWKECPLCPVPGFVPTVAAADFDPMQRMAVLEAMGEQAEPQYRENPNFEACPDCNGYGDVLTGSKRDVNRLQGCPTCAGMGYRDKRVPGQHLPVQAPAPLVAAPAHSWPNDGGTKDAWNRPEGHPHYGIAPEFAGL